MKEILTTLISSTFLLCGLWLVSKNEKFQFFGNIIDRVETSQRVVALTFDDGPTATKTDKILDILMTQVLRQHFFDWECHKEKPIGSKTDCKQRT